jgi:ABC-type antimicrobial peptide transport system permease subunit
MSGRNLLTIFFSLLFIAIMLTLEKPISAQVSHLNYTVVLEARVVFDQPPQKPVNFTLTLSPLGPLTFSWSINQSGSLTYRQEVTLEDERPWIGYIQLSADTCIQLNRIRITTGSFLSTQGWNVYLTGGNYRYYAYSQFRRGEAQILQDDSILEYRVNTEERTISINLTLVVSLAKAYMVDISPLQKLNPRITLDETPGIHIGRLENGSRFIIARYNLNGLTLSGKYLIELPSLEYSSTLLTIPFKISLNLDKETLEIGPQIFEVLFNTTNSLIESADELLSDAKIYAPDISAKLNQAKSYLEELANPGKELAEINTFPLEDALNLVCEASNEIGVLVFSSMFIAPIITPIIFVASTVVSNIASNKNKRIMIIFFALFLLIVFEFHPGLRLTFFSIKQKALIDFWSTTNFISGVPFLILPAASIALSLAIILLMTWLVNKYSGTATLYSLAASTALRMLKSRKIRGILVLITVATIAMATVPAITLRTVIPLITTLETGKQDGGHIVVFSKSWLAKVTISTPARSSSEEYNGLFLMSRDEAVFHAKKLGMTEYTPICIGFYNSSILKGLIVFANLTFLESRLGLETAPQTADFKNGILIDENLFQNQSPPNYLIMGNLKLNVTGTFNKSTLLIPNGEALEDYLRRKPIFVGTINWNSILLPSLLIDDTLLSQGNRIVVTLSPIIGLVDIEVVKNLPFLERVVTIIGTYPPEKTVEIKNYLKSTISSHKILLSRSITTGEEGTAIDIVSSYSATLKSGLQLETIQLGAPFIAAFGNWSSILMLISIGSLIILSTMLNSVYERRRESTIMSSLGAPPSFITYMFLIEGLVIGVIGGCLGYVFGYVSAYSIGTSTPEIAAELYSPMSLILVFLISILVTGISSAFPAKEAILQIVPSKVMLMRGGVPVEIEKDGSRRTSAPIRLRKEQLEQFTSFIINMARSQSYSLYGITVYSYEKNVDGIRLNLSYKTITNFSERIAYYDVIIKYVPSGNFYNVEFVVKSPVGKWLEEQKALVKPMLYDLREELLKITVSEQWTSSKREE